MAFELNIRGQGWIGGIEMQEGFDMTGKESLGEILGVVWTMSESADQTIEGQPVGLAQGFERDGGLGRTRVAGGQDEGPTGGGEGLHVAGED